jgi:hypothetical protein
VVAPNPGGGGYVKNFHMGAVPDPTRDGAEMERKRPEFAAAVITANANTPKNTAGRSRFFGGIFVATLLL